MKPCSQATTAAPPKNKKKGGFFNAFYKYFTPMGLGAQADRACGGFKGPGAAATSQQNQQQLCEQMQFLHLPRQSSTNPLIQ
jgi:hypothetical protein